MITPRYQLLIICSNSESCIYRTLLTWKPYVHKVSILINNTDDNTEPEILRVIPNAHIYHRPFTGFSSTRNELIKLSFDENIDYNIFIDDSYECMVFKNIPNVVDIGLVNINTEKYVYHSARIFKMNPNIVYEGSIHETITGSDKRFLINGFEVYDRFYPEHFDRTITRTSYDLHCLKDLSDPRSRYYRACCYIKLNNFVKAKELLTELCQEQSMYQDLAKQIFNDLGRYEVL